MTDFDNTLVVMHGQLLPEVVETIHKLMDAGILVTIATGRAYYGVIKDACKDLGLTSPQVVYGGAEIRDPVTEEVLWKAHISPALIEKLKEYCLKNRLPFVFGKDQTVYGGIEYDMSHLLGNAFILKQITGHPQEEMAMFIIPARHAHLTGEEATRIEAELQQLFPELHVVKMKLPFGYGIDITAANATKHIAVLELMKLKGLDREEVIGIGDGYNDFPLLSACGTKVAMGDAPDELKAIADTVVAPATELGFVRMAKTYFPHIIT